MSLLLDDRFASFYSTLAITTTVGLSFACRFDHRFCCLLSTDVLSLR